MKPYPHTIITEWEALTALEGQYEHIEQAPEPEVVELLEVYNTKSLDIVREYDDGAGCRVARRVGDFDFLTKSE